MKIVRFFKRMILNGGKCTDCGKDVDRRYYISHVLCKLCYDHFFHILAEEMKRYGIKTKGE